MLRKIDIFISGEIMGKAIVWGYPRDDAREDDIGPLYEVPTYKMVIRGSDDKGKEMKREFEVIRFGVHQKTTKHKPSVVGLAKEQQHVIKAWLPDYSVHSAESEERGAWKVIDDFLIHDGPDNPQDKDDPYASIGCVEVCGERGFIVLNEYLVSLSGSTAVSQQQKLSEMGNSGTMTARYEGTVRPPLKLAK